MNEQWTPTGEKKMKEGHITIRRLRKCVKVLRSIPEPGTLLPDGYTKFTMRLWVHQCGTPACVLGWYAANTPERFTLKGSHIERLGEQVYDGPIEEETLMNEFPGLTYEELNRLFGSNGCGGATSGDTQAAARYIEDFIIWKLTVVTLI
jgi:hypothetical protein